MTLSIVIFALNVISLGLTIQLLRTTRRLRKASAVACSETSDSENC